MFRKFLSGVSFSPSVASQIGSFLRRLKKDELARRFGIIAIVLALVVQAVAVLNPVEQRSSNTDLDLIPGGVSQPSQVIEAYNSSQSDFSSIANYIGISEQELASMSSKIINVCSSNKEVTQFSRGTYFSSADEEVAHSIVTQSGGFSVIFSVPLWKFDSFNNSLSCYEAYEGNSNKIGWFAVAKSSGNFFVKSDTQKVPAGYFTSATCSSVKGTALDSRLRQNTAKVHLYINGHPGTGEQFGPIQTSKDGSFIFSIPEKYLEAEKEIPVWGVVEPKAGWNQPTVHFTNTTLIQKGCKKTDVSPVTACENLSIIQPVRRTIRLSANASSNHQTELSYKFTITNNSKELSDTVKSSGLYAKSKNFILEPGDYSATVEISSKNNTASCTKNFTVSNNQSCQYLNTNHLTPTDPTCSPCLYGEGWSGSEDCNPKITNFLEAVNLTNRLDANHTTANVSDRIELKLYTTNISDENRTVKIEKQVSNINDYARIIDNGGATYDSQSKIINWGEVKLAPKQTAVKSVTIQINDIITGAPRAANNPATFNCSITSAFGNTIQIGVNCPFIKSVESTINKLPRIDAAINVVFAITLLIVTVFLYARTRQLEIELREVNKDFNGGR